MTNDRNKVNSELSNDEKIREAEKMIADGMPTEVICRILRISPLQLKELRQQGYDDFK